MELKVENIILSVVLYGCENNFLKLREKRTLRMFENMVLRRIFGPKRDDVRGEWRKLHTRNSLICTAHQIYSGDQMKKNVMGGACGMYGREERCI